MAQTYEDYRKSLVASETQAAPHSVLSRTDFEKQNTPTQPNDTNSALATNAIKSATSNESFSDFVGRVGSGGTGYYQGKEYTINASGVGKPTGNVNQYNTEEDKGTTLGKSIGLLGAGQKVLSPEEEAVLAKKERDAELSARQTETKLSQQIRESQLSQDRKIAEKGVQGLKSSLATGQGMPGFGGGMGTATEFASQTQQNITRAIQQKDLAVQQENRLMADLKAANEKNDRVASATLSRQLELAKAATIKAEEDRITAETLQKKESRDLISQAQKDINDTLTGLGDSVGKLDPNDIIDLVGNKSDLYGLDSTQTASVLGSALAFQALKKQAQELDQKSPDYQNKLLANQKLLADIAQIGVEKPTAAQQNFDYLVGLESAGATPVQIQAFKDFADAGSALDFMRVNLLQSQIQEQNLKNAGLERDLGLDSGTFGFTVTSNPDANTRADRNNNPGNVKIGGNTDSEGFTVFATPEEGFQAMINDVTAKVTGNSPMARKQLGKDASTLYELLQVYAPAADNNDPLSYANAVAETLNVKYDTPLALLQSRIPELAKAMAAHEGYQGTITLGSTQKRLNADQQDLVEQALNGDRSIKDIQSTLPVADKAKVAAEFGRQLQQRAAKEPNPVKRNMILSLGKSEPDQTEALTLDKTFRVSGQLKDVMDKVQEMVDKGSYGLGPIEGRIGAINPYYDDYVELESLLQGLTPGVARGTFGEVGVLTDNDINLYKKVIGSPLNTASQIKEQQKNLQKLLYRSFEGYMNSATYNTYQRMSQYDSIVNSLSPEAKKELGINLSPSELHSTIIPPDAQALWASLQPASSNQ